MTTATGARGTGQATSGRRGAAKVRLDRESIVAAGLELAAASGSATLSVRELGARLGADPTAIYRHFRNKEQLMQALLDELNARSVATVTAPVDDWRARIRLCQVYPLLVHAVLFRGSYVEAAEAAMRAYL